MSGSSLKSIGSLVGLTGIALTLGTGDVKKPDVNAEIQGNQNPHHLELRRPFNTTPEWMQRTVPQDLRDRIQDSILRRTPMDGNPLSDPTPQVVWVQNPPIEDTVSEVQKIKEENNELRQSSVIESQETTVENTQINNINVHIDIVAEKNAVKKENQAILKNALNKRFREQRAKREATRTPTVPLTISEKEMRSYTRNLNATPPMLEKEYSSNSPFLANELIIREENMEIMPTAEELEYAVEKFNPETKEAFFKYVSAQDIIDYSNKYKTDNGEPVDPVAVLGFIQAENRLFTDGATYNKKTKNPGALRNSDLKIGIDYGMDSGGFAVFESIQKGTEAIPKLFIDSPLYVKQGITGILDAKKLYSPWHDKNNPLTSALAVQSFMLHTREGILEHRKDRTNDLEKKAEYDKQIAIVQTALKQTNGMYNRYRGN
jgi:hypothetical protein